MPAFLHGSHGVTPEHRVLRSLQFSQALFDRNLGLDGPASDMRTDDINNMSTEAILPTTPGPGSANPDELFLSVPYLFIASSVKTAFNLAR